jgi:hypothetical protein
MAGSAHVRAWGLGDEGWLEADRALWDERVPVHAARELHGLDAFLADPAASWPAGTTGLASGPLYSLRASKAG